MSKRFTRFRRLIAAATSGIALTTVWMIGAPAAEAAPGPVVPAAPDTITADALPTVQIDGVVWSQAVVGNTVWAGGRFSNARPYGAAAGTNLTSRSNLLAYDITTGNLVTSIAPSLNGQVRGVAASPDGTRVYVVGDFTTVTQNGTSYARRRVAAFNASTGALITAFAPVGVDAGARAVVATDSAVYVGGSYTSAGGTARSNLAGFAASNGALLSWNPNADFLVSALAASSDGQAIFVGGSFQNMGGQPAYGLAKVSATTGALDTGWHAADTVRNAGADAGITSLNVQNGFVYGTTYHFGPGGNIEGTFKAPVDTGVVEWVTDCHGDMYSSYVNSGVVYIAGHSHYCGNMGGGYPQYPTWKYQHAIAFTDAVGGDILNDVQGYPNWHGVKPGPSLVNWLPDMGIGSATGQYQAGWSVSGNSSYVVYGGEFPSVNGSAQQGLVRFAKRPTAPAKQGARFVGNSVTPTLVPISTTAVRVTWPAGYDRDSRNLTYKVIRNSSFNAPRATMTADSNWWTLPALGYVDTGLAAGTTYSYSIVVSDSDGNTIYGGSASVTMPTSVTAVTSYSDAVRGNGARTYWPLNETSGTVARDRAASATSGAGIGVTDLTAGTGVTWGAAGSVTGDASASFAGNDASRSYSNGTEIAPDTFSSQAWFKTTTTSGGQIIGFGDLQSGDSGHRDRQVFMDNNGRLVFGVKGQDNTMRTVSSGKTYNDNAWHQVTATMSSAGMVLYVDGVRVARRSDTTQGEAYLGYWRVGGDNLDGWSGQPSSRNFAGSIDEVAIYPTALGQDAVNALYVASGRTSVVPPSPGDAYGAAVYTDDPDLYWRLGESSGSTAQDSGRSQSTGTYRNGVSLGQTGVITGNWAAKFDGSNAFVSSDAQYSNPRIYSEEAWFKTSTTRGGKIIGFGSEQGGSSGGYDRHVYMQDDGKLVFGVWTGQTNTITTPGLYNDNEWHHVVATQSGDGLKLYVDGVLIGTNPQTEAQDYNGYWKVGGDNTWGSSSAYFDGTIDEAAVYSYALGADRVTAHFLAGGGHLNQPPVAEFTSTTDGRRANFDGSGSHDTDGTIASYGWDFGDGTTSTSTSPTTSHVFKESGTYSVTLTATDNKGAATTVTHDVVVTAPPAPSDTYGSAVYADAPRIYWRLSEASGNVATDASGAQSGGHYFNGYTLGESGALPINNNKAAKFDGNGGFLSSDEQFDNPTTYTEEAWFKTTTTRGGKILGFGRNQSGSSSSYDRHVYMQDDGHLVFGTYTGQLNTVVTPGSYNNGQWHHVVAAQGSGGMKLYVDGELVGTNPETGSENYPGYWKVGGDNTWGSSSAYFDGTIDEVAIYDRVLSAARVTAHYVAAAPAPNQDPTAKFSVVKDNLAVAVDASESDDADGTIEGYNWDFGDGWTTTGKTAAHTYAQKGTYEIKLTVTDDDGATKSVTHEVSVKPANVAPTARFDTDINDLVLDVDAGASTDSDGDVDSYVWDFGDGASGVGKKATHTYAQAGTKTVTLTVTDNDGATDVVTHDVTATEPPNQAPIAAFSGQSDNLVYHADASTSSDADGSIEDYTWSWSDDGDKAASGQKPDLTFSKAGTYSVTLTVTDNDSAKTSVTHDVTVTAANQSPTAAFTASVNNLKVDVDAGDSDDPDGSIQSYAWDFGGGVTKSGESASYSYPTAGTKTITLTVTDNKGATSVVSHDVVVTDPPNQSPTAAFTITQSDLTVSVNAGGSTDPDGTIAGYSWSFGTTGAASGVTASYTFPAAGTFPITLTVTDNKGAVGTVTKNVSVTAPSVIAKDAFNRTVTNGWGSADAGGAWTTSSTTTNFNVVNGAATIRTTTSSGPAAYLNGVSAADVDVTAAIGYDKVGTGGGTYTALVARRTGTSDYRVKVRVVGSTTYLYLARTVNNTETTLATQTISGLGYSVGDTFQVRFVAQGSGTTALRAKVWRDGSAEPSSWQATASDATASLQSAGSVGVWSYLSGSSTNSPVTLRVDDFAVAPAN